jgi:GNAT superfamily N-acetyltransferase
MAAEFAVRRAERGDLPRILSLLRLSLGEGGPQREGAFWRWKHEQNPFGSSPVLVAEAGGEIVGLRAFLHWGWSWNGQQIRAVRAVDTATHPAWRRRGIFRKLTLKLAEEMREEGVEFVFNTPGPESLPGYLKLGWQSVGRVGVRVRPSASLLTAVLRRRGEPSAALAPLGQPAEEALRAPGLDALLERTGRRADRTSSHPPNVLQTLLTPEFLRWRYADVPGLEYRALGTIDDTGEGALLLFRMKARGGVREIRIVELLLARGSERSRQVARALLDEVGRAPGSDLCSLRCVPGSTLCRLSWKAGFLPLPRLGPVLTVFPLGSPYFEFVLPQRAVWNAATLGDLELL